jgi:hypothetical protein
VGRLDQKEMGLAGGGAVPRSGDDMADIISGTGASQQFSSYGKRLDIMLKAAVPAHLRRDNPYNSSGQ